MGPARKAPPATDQLSSALFGKTRRAVLALFYSQPDRTFHLREVSRLTRSGQGAVQRELRRLTQAQILTRMNRAARAEYQANRECPIFSDLHNLILKTAGVVEVVRMALAPLTNRIQVAAVYGSVARGEAKAASDVDLLVIGDVTFGEVVDTLSDAQRQLARDVNPTVYTPAEYRKRLSQKDHFLSTLSDAQKMFVIGSNDDIEQLARKRVARRA
jgi:predicted nucleotidyltransferase